MSNYQKFDPSILRARIKEGAYPSLVGANRAIGKTQGLSEEDRASLKKYAAKHFGADAPAAATSAPKAAKKAAKKAVAKKAAKKTAKKAGKREAKTTRGAKASAEPSTEADPAPAVVEEQAPAVKKTRAKRGSKAQAATQLELPLTGVREQAGSASITSEQSDGPVSVARLMGSVIGSCDQMIRAINLTNDVLPKDVAEAGNKAAIGVMTRAVEVLDQQVVTPLFSSAITPTPTRAGTPPKPRTPKKTAAPAVTKPVPEPSTELNEASDASDEDNDDEDVAHIPPESDLTEDDQELLNVARETQTASLNAAGLNKVPRGLGG